MEQSNKVIDITGDIIHELACDFNTTMRDINKSVGDDVFKIVSRLNKEFNS